MALKKTELSNLIVQQREFININDDEEYRRCTVKLHRQGIVLRDVVKGKDIKTKKQQVCKAGQLLVAEIDAKVGGYGIVPSELDGAIVSSHYFLFDINEELLDRQYLNCYLKTEEFFKQIKPQGSTNYSAIRPKDVSKINIPVSSLDEQRKLSKLLHEIFENKDKLDTVNSHNSEILNMFRQSILQEAVQGKLVPQDPNDEPASVLLGKIKSEKERLIKEGKIKKEKPFPPITEDEIPYELPRGWEWVRLIEIGKTQTGTTPSTSHSEYFGGKYPFIKPADITEKGINYFNESLTEEGLSQGRLIKSNSVMMVCIGGSTGKAYFTDRDCSCNQQINTITGFCNINAKFIYYFVSSSYFYKEVLLRATGTATPIINKSKWETILFPLPPLAEQKRIEKKVDQLMSLCDELEENTEQSKNDSELLMQSVLQKAFREA